MLTDVRCRNAKATDKAYELAVAASNTFETMARVWQERQASILAARYAGQVLDLLQADIVPAIDAGKAETDPAAIIRPALQPPTKRLRPPPEARASAQRPA